MLTEKLTPLLLLSVIYVTHNCVGSKIIGGHEVKPHSRPYMVSLQSKGYHFCGGALILKVWVVTAAHCKDSFEDPVTVVLGAHSLLRKETSKRIVKIKRVVIYPNFSKNPKLNDIMLLQLEKWQKNKNIQSLKLPVTATDATQGMKCTVTGWGTVDRHKILPSDKLNEAEVIIIDRKLCNSKKYYNLSPPITENMLCAGSIDGKKDSCHGDSGGPLICDGVFKGIVSGGDECGHRTKPGIYTQLTMKYISWINKVIKPAENDTAAPAV